MEEIKIGDRCPQCNAKAEKRVCSECGAERIEIDCGHFMQPLFISANSKGIDICYDCIYNSTIEDDDLKTAR